ncbi:MAG: UDP-N-acetylmuramoyl-L-alanyl-D-glutamate--2,6-diaminopimelate ligase, partial [Chlorobi bacterium]|nr:UDP-N-acetylmuramoyl-L-alanyl-D-glutamate--2,6-diaminopimelate ligase [Chlorobiota bacterium]
EEIPATHTTPESLELCQHLALMREKKVEAIVMEVSSHALHQHRVRGVEFDAGIYTNLTHEHLDYHKTLDEYAAAKKRLFDMLPEDSLAVVNSDADYAEYMLKDCRSAKKIRVGRTDQSDICIRDEKLNINSSEFSLSENGNISNYSTKLIGRFNIDNIAQSLALCAFVTGRKIEDLKDSIINAEGAPGRMQRTNLKNGSIGIVDYAHTPDALEKALTACRDILETSGRQESRLYCVFGCGGDRDSAKRPIMGELSGRIADFSIITDDNPRTEDPGRIIEQIYNGVGSKNKSKIVMISDRREAIGSAVKMAGENDIILIAGKGHEDYQIVGTEKTHFDDREELEKFS